MTIARKGLIITNWRIICLQRWRKILKNIEIGKIFWLRNGKGKRRSRREYLPAWFDMATAVGHETSDDMEYKGRGTYIRLSSENNANEEYRYIYIYG